MKIHLTYVPYSVLLVHCYPVFANFKGGKAVSTAIGLFYSSEPFRCYTCFSSFLYSIED
nr:glycerol-3-phosphate acyltransferase [Thomasclavelia cocleata]